LEIRGVLEFELGKVEEEGVEPSEDDIMKIKNGRRRDGLYRRR